MPRAILLDTMRAMMEIPTAPFREQWVIHHVEQAIAGLPGVEMESDRFGNRIIRLRRGEPKGAPLVFVAHLDHPGFVFEKDAPIRNENGRYFIEGVFEGRVRTQYFPSAPVRLFRSPEDTGIPGTVAKITEERPVEDNRHAVIETADDPAGAVLGMWDFPACEEKDGLVASRACDDLAGCAILLEALRREALDSTAPIDLSLVYTRAEECGFCGALCLMEERPFPRLLAEDGIFVSVETSAETGPAILGAGAIVRIGDRTTTFDGNAADDLWAAGQEQGLPVKRALMDRGTCEATVIARAGLRTAAVCIPLRNYHNMDTAAERLAPEMVSAGDAEALLGLVRALAQRQGTSQPARPVVNQRYTLFLEKGRHLLTE